MYPFKEGSFAVRNCWYVAAWSDQVTRVPLERWFLDMPVVLYRREDGSPVAVAGRCPHRQFPMAAGTLQGDTLVCGYHGIAFGPDGLCTRIPAQTNLPASFRIRTYPLVERDGWIWIWAGDAEAADEALLPDLAATGWMAPEASSSAMHYNLVNGRYQLLNDNLLDLTHLAFLHSTNIGMEEVATTEDKVEVGDDFVRSIRTISNASPSPSVRASHGDVRVNFYLDFVFLAPGIHYGINRTNLTDESGKDGKLLLDTTVYHAITPATRNSCHYFFGRTLRYPEADFDQTKAAIGIAKVLGEDIFATEEIERLVTTGSFRDLLTRGDVAVSRGRALLQRWMDREAAGQDAGSRPDPLADQRVSVA